MHIIPKHYKCSNCGVYGVKLWRQYNSFDINLLCVDCALEDQNRNFEVMENGEHEFKYEGGNTTRTSDNIVWLVLAVPPCFDDGIDGSYWGYTSVPQELCEWWTNFPLRRKQKCTSTK